MADPRFFKNLGPFTLAQICEKSGIAVPAAADPKAAIADLADLAGAGPSHLTFFSGASLLRDAFAASHAGFCFIPDANMRMKRVPPPAGMVTLDVASVSHSFATAAHMFYPENSQPLWNQDEAISPRRGSAPMSASRHTSSSRRAQRSAMAPASGPAR